MSEPIEFVLDAHKWVRGIFDKDILKYVPLERLGERPGRNTNSIAWVVWHLARLEDLVVNTFARGEAQVLTSGDWMSKVGLDEARIGNSMGDDEISEFGEAIDPQGLLDYWEAVCAATDAWVSSLDPSSLDQVPDVRANVAAAPDGAPGAEEVYIRGHEKASIGYLIKWPFTLHGYIHLGEMFTLKGLMGIEGG